MSNCQNLQEPEDRKKEKLKEEEKKKRSILTWGETPLQNFSISFYNPQPILFNTNLPK